MGTRLKDVDWMPGDDLSQARTWVQVQVAILLDLRDELRQLNRLLGCYNFTSLPGVLREVRDSLKTRACPGCGRLFASERGVRHHQRRAKCVRRGVRRP